jgi:glycosyltransferase involved in cell wall biosynthesis
MMHLGLDAKRLLFNRSGLGNYARSTVRALALCAPELQMTLFAPRNKAEWIKDVCFEGFDDPDHFTNTKMFYPSYAMPWWRSLGMGKAAAAQGVEVFHGLSNEIPFDLPTNIRKVCTIHDLIFIDQPKHYPWLDRQVYLKKVKHALNHSDAIIATSEATRDRILFHFPNTQAPIHVVYQPIHPIFKSVPSAPHNHPPYFIYHSGFNQRKNHLRLLEAFESVMHNIQQHLVLIGIKGDTYEQVNAFIQRSHLKNRVKIMTKVGNEELANWLHHAEGFIYPSITEGFGIPLAEAAACGLKAAISNIPVFQELSNGGMIMFDPLETSSIANAIMSLSKLEHDQELKQAASRIQILDRINDQNIAHQLLHIYSKPS